MLAMGGFDRVCFAGLPKKRKTLRWKDGSREIPAASVQEITGRSMAFQLLMSSKSTSMIGSTGRHNQLKPESHRRQA